VRAATMGWPSTRSRSVQGVGVADCLRGGRGNALSYGELTYGELTKGGAEMVGLKCTGGPTGSSRRDTLGPLCCKQATPSLYPSPFTKTHTPRLCAVCRSSTLGCTKRLRTLGLWGTSATKVIVCAHDGRGWAAGQVGQGWASQHACMAPHVPYDQCSAMPRGEHSTAWRGDHSTPQCLQLVSAVRCPCLCTPCAGTVASACWLPVAPLGTRLPTWAACRPSPASANALSPSNPACPPACPATRRVWLLPPAARCGHCAQRAGRWALLGAHGSLERG